MMPMDLSTGVTDSAYDPENHSVLLGCADGHVRQMDLATGFESSLLCVPGGNLIHSLRLSADRTVLCTVDYSMHDLQRTMDSCMDRDPVAAAVHDESVPRLLIWDYRKLHERPAPASRVLS
jgi:hypothetical protein